MSSGYLGNLSKDQEEKLKKFKENLQDVLLEKHTDMHLLRFLRARNFNLKKSEDLFRKDLEWRQYHKITTLLEDFQVPEAVDNYWIGGEIGTDKDGNIVAVIPLGHIDPRGIIKVMKSSETTRIGIWQMQQLYNIQKENSRKQGRYIEGIVIVFDMEGLNATFLWKPAINFFNEIMEQHYPETIKRIYITRAPAMFPLAYSLVKPFLHENTKKKIKICKSKFEKTLLKRIDASVLPKHWGGTRVDPDGDPKCPSLIKLGGKIPERYYVNDNLFDEDALTKLVIGKGSSKDLKYDVRVQGSAIRYLFKTDEGEITFGISRMKGTKGTPEVLFAPTKMTCHITPADGEVCCEKIGNYTFHFENPSKMKSKTLSYQIEVLEPDEEEAERGIEPGEDED